MDNPSCVLRANAGRNWAGLEACIYGLQRDVLLRKNRTALFRSGEGFGGYDDPAKRGNHQQAQEQSEPQHDKVRILRGRTLVNRNRTFRHEYVLVRSSKNSPLPLLNRRALAQEF